MRRFVLCVPVVVFIGLAPFAGGVAEAQVAICEAPWGLLDKWEENQTPPWDPSDTYDRYRPNGNLLDLPLDELDEYVAPDNSPNTSFDFTDFGKPLLVNDHLFVPLDSNPGLDYEATLTQCSVGDYAVGDSALIEPSFFQGKFAKPTIAGAAARIVSDAGASWDDGVIGSNGNRIVRVALLHTDLYALDRITGQPKLAKVVGLLDVFIESIIGNEVQIRLLPLAR